MDFTYSATYGTRDIAFFFYQIYHRADIGRDLTPDAGDTLIHGVIPCALRDTCISPATNVCPTSQSTRLKIYSAFAQSQLYDVKAQLADDELVATEARNSLRLSFLVLTTEPLYSTIEMR